MIVSSVVQPGEFQSFDSNDVLRIREVDIRSSVWCVAQTIGRYRYRIFVHADEVDPHGEGRRLRWPIQCPANWEMA